MFIKSVTCLVLTGLILVTHGYNEEEWKSKIAVLLKEHLEDFAAGDFDRHAEAYTVDGHRLAPGNPVVVGRKAIAESYQDFPKDQYPKTLEMTDLRFYCHDGAAFEFSSLLNNDQVARGVMIVKFEDGVLKTSSLIMNFSN